MEVDNLIRTALDEGLLIVDEKTGTIWRPTPKGLRRIVPEMNGKGYLRFRFAVHGVRCHFRVHRVVYMAVHGSIPEGYHIDHVNGNKQDNRICNLQPLTDLDNKRKQVAMRNENRSRPQPLLFFC